MTAAVKFNKTGIEELDRIKKNINQSYLYFKPNYDRFHKFRKFVFQTSLDQQEKDVLISLKKPIIEFNILEAYISRLLGEFAKHEPSIEITPADGAPIDIETIKLVEGHIRHIIYEANKNSCSYEVYKDLLSGGFSVVKIWTDWASPMSRNQVIKLGRVFDPTLCGFDPMAQYSHKGDGRYCYEIFPQSKADFEREHPGINVDGISYQRNIEGFNWSYMNEKEEIIVRAEYFEKKIKRTKIVHLANGRSMTEKNYQKFEQYWKDNEIFSQIPAIVGKSRMADLETICRYRLIASEIMNYKETDFTYLPRIFVDGNSIMIRDGNNNSVQQMTRPYVYHAEGIQKLKNFAGQTLGNELENMIQHKIIIAEEALPQQEDYLESYDNIQQASSYVYRSYNENNPDQQIPAPREIVRTPIPPEVMNTFGVTDSTTNMIMGTFDSENQMNKSQLSGEAVIQIASVNNAVAMPYVTGYLQAWTHIGCIITDLLPLYIDTPRTIPVVGIDGKREYKKVNQKDGKGAQLDYDQSALQIYVEAGVNFQIAKNQAMAQLIALMKNSEQFSAFMNGPALGVLVDNLTIYGADVLKEMVPAWQKQQAEAAAEQKKMQQETMMNDPRMITAKSKAMKDHSDIQLGHAKFGEEKVQNDFDRKIAIAELTMEDEESKAKIQEEHERSKAEVEKATLDAAGKIVEHRHNSAMDKERLAHDKEMAHHASIRESVALHHEIKQAEKEANKPEPKKEK